MIGAVARPASRIPEGKPMRESALALRAEAQGWMRADLAEAERRGMVRIAQLEVESDEDFTVEVLPGQSGPLDEFFLTERALAWDAYFAERAAR